MSDLKQETIFTNIQLDTDTDQRFMSVGAAPSHINILIGEEGSNAVVTNQKGNKQGSVSYPLTNSNVYLVVGSYYNRLTRKVYYFIFSQPYDSTGSEEYLYDNKLLCYNEDEETIDCIFTDTKNYFGLHFNYFMRDCEMIGDWLFFNPQVSEPKMIDVERAYNYENYDEYDATLSYLYGSTVRYLGGLFSANTAVNVGESPVNASIKWDRVGNSYQEATTLNFYSEFDYAFNLIKQPPVYRPSCVYDYDANNFSNNIRGIVFQFAYRYKYFDNSYSVYSPYSDVTLPNYSEYYNGEIDTSTCNFIQINLRMQSSSLVKEIEIVFKEIGGDWKRAKILNRQDINLLAESSYTYKFYNNESYAVVDSTQVAKIYDAVPKLAKSQSLINKNILCYGGCTEGFNNVDKNDIDVILEPELLTFTTPQSVGMIRRDNVHSNDIKYTTRWVQVDRRTSYVVNIITISFSSWFATAGIQPGDIYSIFISSDSRRGLTGESEHSYTIQMGDIISVQTFILALANFIENLYEDYDIITDLAAATIAFEYRSRPETIEESKIFLPSTLTDQALYKRRGFKTGAWHPFCIFYYDSGMRRSDAQTSQYNEVESEYAMDGTSVFVPMFNEISPNVLTTNHRWIINWSVNHTPPSWARYWRWGYAGNSLCSYFVQYVINGIEDEVTDPPNTTKIDITPLQELKTSTTLGNQYPNSIIEPYIWIKGDRVRFITEQEGVDDLGDLIDGVYDFEILKLDTENNYIYTQQFDFTSINIQVGSLIEIYRPLKTDTETIYYEFGDIYRIIEDSSGELIHTGAITDQNILLGTAATGIFDSGDVYHILRTPSRAISGTVGYFHESQWYSDFYNSDEWGKGKIGVETTFGERYLNIIRFSNPYLQNTQIMGLSTFEALNYKELNDIYGDIVAIMEIGNTLKCYQRTKPSSILIGRQEYTDTEGNSTVATSTSVLGSIRYSTTNYGTEFPESLSRNNRYVYGYDIYNATVFRDSANGIFPISGRFVTTEGDTDYKMSSFFKEISKSLMLSGIDNVRVMTVWDEEYKLLYISFHDAVNENNNKTVVFHEPSNKWLCFSELEIINHNGYNVILELTYDILKGFEGGIGYEFDEETRFAIFSIVTGSGVLAYFGTIGLSYEALEPTIMISSNPGQDLISLAYTALEPAVYISYSHFSDTDLDFDYDDYGFSDSQSIVLDTSESHCTVISKPSWLVVFRASMPISIGDTIPDGSDLDIFPLVENTGPELNDVFEVEDAYGNVASLAVKHRQNMAGVVVYVLATIPPPLIITDNGCTGTYGSANIIINFTPDTPEHTIGQTISLSYTILKNGSSTGTGTISATEQQANTRTLTMGETAVNGDIIDVYLEYNS